jgi:hypothetical protein
VGQAYLGYTIEETIGAGGFGIVFRIRHSDGHTDVLKVR